MARSRDRGFATSYCFNYLFSDINFSFHLLRPEQPQAAVIPFATAQAPSNRTKSNCDSMPGRSPSPRELDCDRRAPIDASGTVASDRCTQRLHAVQVVALVDSFQRFPQAAEQARPLYYMCRWPLTPAGASPLPPVPIDREFARKSTGFQAQSGFQPARQRRPPKPEMRGRLGLPRGLL